jgi:uncharacterized membrane protein
MRYRALIFWGIVAAALAVSVVAWDHVPEQIDTHWNAAGDADSTMPKFWGLLLMPIVLAAMTLVTLWIPRIDPLSRNIALFRKYYDGFMLMLLLFTFAVHVFLVFWNSGTKLSPNYIFSPALAALFYAIGVLCGVAKRNWFIGVRTPWTLSSDAVWDKTHRQAKPLFKLAGLLSLGGIFLGENAIYLILSIILGITFYLVIYSYLEYRREEQPRETGG